MEIRVQSIKFNADQKLLDFVEKKLSRIEKFNDAITGVDVALSLLPDHQNKNVKIQVSIPGSTIVVEKNAKTFEDAVVDCADILKEKLVKVKERRAEKIQKRRELPPLPKASGPHRSDDKREESWH